MRQQSLIALVGLFICSLIPAIAEEPVPKAVIVPREKHIDFRVGKALVGRYHIAPSVAKPYFWPLNAPNGTPITRGWPMVEAEPGERKDHVHQKSAWFCHGDIIPEGMKIDEKIKGIAGVDFWSEHKGHGKIVCTKVGKVKQDENHAQITTWNEWQTASGKKVLSEERTFHLINFGKAQLIILESDLHADVVPITFGDTKEGSMGVRVRDSMTEKNGGKLESSNGEVKAVRLWGRYADWNDYSGPIPTEGAGKVTAGIAIFDDPGNAPRAAWHSRNYGLMAANPFGRAKSRFPATREGKELKRIKKGEHLKLRYGLYVHMGDAKAGNVADAYAKFKKLK